MAEKWVRGKSHSTSGKRQKTVGFSSSYGGFERKDSSLGVQKTVFGTLMNGSLLCNGRSIAGQGTVHWDARNRPLENKKMSENRNMLIS